MNLVGAVVAGVIGALVVSLVLSGGQQLGFPKVDLAGKLAALVKYPQPVRAFGWGLHLAIGAMWGIIYAAVWNAGFGTPDVTIGLLFGVVHWLIAGALIGLVFLLRPVESPGWYLQGYGRLGFLAGLVSHVIFGLTVGLVYQIFQFKPA